MIGNPSGQFMTTKDGAFKGPLSVLKLCVAVSGYYKDFLGRRRQIHPAMLQWPAAPGAHQWSKGPVISDPDNSAWLPGGTGLAAAYALRGLFDIKPDGTRQLRPGALACDRPEER
jgi:hypothetical protein